MSSFDSHLGRPATTYLQLVESYYHRAFKPMYIDDMNREFVPIIPIMVLELAGIATRRPIARDDIMEERAHVFAVIKAVNDFYTNNIEAKHEIDEHYELYFMHHAREYFPDFEPGGRIKYDRLLENDFAWLWKYYEKQLNRQAGVASMPMSVPAAFVLAHPKAIRELLIMMQEFAHFARYQPEGVEIQQPAPWTAGTRF